MNHGRSGHPGDNMSDLQQHEAARNGADTPCSETQASYESVSVTKGAAARSDSFVGSRPDDTAAQDSLGLELDQHIRRHEHP